MHTKKLRNKVAPLQGITLPPRNYFAPPRKGFERLTVHHSPNSSLGDSQGDSLSPFLVNSLLRRCLARQVLSLMDSLNVQDKEMKLGRRALLPNDSPSSSTCHWPHKKLQDSEEEGKGNTVLGLLVPFAHRPQVALPLSVGHQMGSLVHTRHSCVLPSLQGMHPVNQLPVPPPPEAWALIESAISNIIQSGHVSARDALLPHLTPPVYAVLSTSGPLGTVFWLYL
eukprot:1138012-Pelagomonas_calceolata.AAC.2